MRERYRSARYDTQTQLCTRSNNSILLTGTSRAPSANGFRLRAQQSLARARAKGVQRLARRSYDCSCRQLRQQLTYFPSVRRTNQWNSDATPERCISLKKNAIRCAVGRSAASVCVNEGQALWCVRLRKRKKAEKAINKCRFDRLVICAALRCARRPRERGKRRSERDGEQRLSVFESKSTNL